MSERDPRDIARIAELEHELEQALDKNAELKRIVDELLERQRQGKRQTSPFARKKVKKDKKKALEWYRRAYRQGDAGAANNIATVYRDLGDTRKMLWWFRRAAAMGDLDVLLDLGKRYEKGLAVSRNPAKAKIFYRRVLANKCATHDDKAEARARLAGLRERPVSRR